MRPIPQFPADLITLTEEILIAKLYLMCSVILLLIFYIYKIAKEQKFSFRDFSPCLSGVFIVNFEHISHLFLVFQLLTLNS